jgi:hypothetical protein
MLNTITEADLYKIKMTGLSRLRPDRLGGFLWLSILFGGIMTIVSLVGVAQSDGLASPWLLTAVRSATVLLGVQLLLAILFSINAISYPLQKLQLIITTIVVIKFSIDTYLFFFMAADLGGAPQYIFNTALILLAGGFVYLAISVIRGFKRAKEGALRKEGRGLYNFQSEKSYISLPAIFGIVMIAGTLAKAVSGMDGSIGMFFILFLCVVIQYAVAMALPEFFLLIYGKSKFKSFIVPPKNAVSRKGKTV